MYINNNLVFTYYAGFRHVKGEKYITDIKIFDKKNSVRYTGQLAHYVGRDTDHRIHKDSD
jgi:hypothetical protein